MQAESIDTLVSEVSRMANGEKALTEECGYLLSKTYSSQVDKLACIASSSFSIFKGFVNVTDCIH